MKRLLSYFVALLMCAVAADARQLDSLLKAELSARLSEYFGALETENLEVQKAEADFMIEASPDTSVRSFVASKIYEMYADSRLMGAEGVAVHVFDKWFRDGGLKMENETDFLNARIFAEFNRSSLIGKKAPELTMLTADGSSYELFHDRPVPGRYSVLFFYDASCAKCKIESILLRNMLATEDFPIDFHAIYVGDNQDAWDEYVAERLSVEPLSAKVIHLWDPQMDSDFQRKYGVLQTPRMFLVDPEGVIMGRGLDSNALSAMLHGIFDEVLLEYGSDESQKLFDTIFNEGGVAPTEEDVRRIADYIEASTMAEGDTVMFRQLTGDLLYYLSDKRSEAFREGAAYLIDEKIISRRDVWRTEDDSLKVIGLAGFMDELLDKAKPGTEIASLKVPGERIKAGRVRSGEYDLRKLRGKRNIVIFHTEGCAVCAAEKKAAAALSETGHKTRVLLVNVDDIVASDPSLANRLFNAFDLSSLPFILETDRKGRILHRYISLITIR